AVGKTAAADEKVRQADERAAKAQSEAAKAKDEAAKAVAAAKKDREEAEGKIAAADERIKQANDRAAKTSQEAEKAIAAAREELDRRFAGMPLTGESVVFVVDISASMKYVDERTKDPQKWEAVCTTVVKVMSSLPKLKQLQVLVFSDEVRYLFPATAGGWMTY